MNCFKKNLYREVFGAKQIKDLGFFGPIPLNQENAFRCVMYRIHERQERIRCIGMPKRV